jgi:hydroxymethylbilane synthase
MCRIVPIKTTGDRLQDGPLSASGGKGLFVKEIEDALLSNEIDLAVHSSKDMPAQLPPGLSIGAVLPRQDPRDAIVMPGPGNLQSPLPTVDALTAALGPSPSLGTVSVRRVAQLTRLFPRARFTALRGNLDTRLRKLDAGDYDAIVLAAAGLHRLGFGSRISFALPVEACVPAPGQGIVAIEIRLDDDLVRGVVSRIDDRWASTALTAERALVAALSGGCQTPIGALATQAGADEIELDAIVIALDGGRMVRARARAPQREAAALGARLAAQLQADGAGDILAGARQAQETAGRPQS